MINDQKDNYVTQRTYVLCSETDKNLKSLSILTVKARSITVKFAHFNTNLNLVNKPFTFIIFIDSWLTYESILVLKNNGCKSHTINGVARTGGCIKIFHLENIITERKLI